MRSSGTLSTAGTSATFPPFTRSPRQEQQRLFLERRQDHEDELQERRVDEWRRADVRQADQHSGDPDSKLTLCGKFYAVTDFRRYLEELEV